MATRLPASMRTREELTSLIEGRLSTASAKDELVKLATRLVVEEALEGEAGDVVGREYYEHGARPGQGYRNGTRAGRLKTAEGFIEYSAPQIAGRDEPFRSAIREHLKGHTQALEDLAIEMLARGLSVRDIEDAFKDESGACRIDLTAEGRRMRPPPHGHEIYFAPIFRLDEWPCDNARMGNAVLWHESEAEARCDHGQNPVIAFTPVDHVPCRATVEQATAIKFAIDAVEIRLALKIRKANRISLRERMTGMDDDHHLLAEERHDVEAFIRLLPGKTVDRNLKIALQKARVELPCARIGQFQFYSRVA